MLAVVEDQQQLLVLEVGTKQGQRLGRGLVAEVEGGHDDVADQRRILELSELGHPRAAREAASEGGRDTDRKAGLSHAARPDQADQTRGRQLLRGFG